MTVPPIHNRSSLHKLQASVALALVVNFAWSNEAAGQDKKLAAEQGNAKTNTHTYREQLYLTPEPVFQFEIGEDKQRTFALSPDGRTLATMNGQGTVCLWNVGNKKQLKTWKVASHSRRVIVFSRDSKTLAIEDGPVIRLYHIPSGNELAASKELPLLKRPVASPAVLFDQTGRYLLAGRDLWDIQKKTRTRAATSLGAVIGAAFSPDNQFIAFAHDRGITISNNVTCETVREINVPRLIRGGIRVPKSMTFISFLPFSQDLLSGDEDEIFCWNLKNGVYRYHILAKGNRSALSPDGCILACGDNDGTVALFEVFTGEHLGTIKAHPSAITYLSFGLSTRFLMSTGANDSSVKVWDIILHGIDQRKQDATGRDVLSTTKQAWDSLARKGTQAFRAAKTIVDNGDRSVEFIKTRVNAVGPICRASLRQLVSDLNDKDFKVRERANVNLEALGPPAASALREISRAESSLEAARRIQVLLNKWDRWEYEGNTLRNLRAIQILGWIATENARASLEGLSRGNSDAIETKLSSLTVRLLKQALQTE